jgi:hypothetical protein
LAAPGGECRARPAGSGASRNGRVKALYVLPLQRDWRAQLCERPVPTLRVAPPAAPATSWAEQEFGLVDFPDARLRGRLLQLAQAFGEHPTASISVALDGAASQIKAAYRFFHNAQVDLPTLLHPHCEASAGRIAEHPLVLVAQDTTSLNYDAHAATRDLGPINTRADGALGLKLHDSLALTPAGVPLGLIDIQVWARDPQQMGQAKQRKERPIAEKESQRWLTSLQRTAEVQRQCPQTRLVNIAEREADIYELFAAALHHPAGPDLLVRASRTTQRQVAAADEQKPLWEFLPAQPVLGGGALHIPARGGRKARRATLQIRAAPIQLRPPNASAAPRRWGCGASMPARSTRPPTASPSNGCCSPRCQGGRGGRVIGSGGAAGDAEVTIDHVGTVENAALVISRLHRGEKRLVFCDSRSRVEALAGALRAWGVQVFVSHSSLAIEERRQAERAFGEASDCVIVATSTLELGIDVGDLDRVIQIDAPATVSSFLQRLGRTGRRPGTLRNCLFLATTDEALLCAAGLALLWRRGYVEHIRPPPKPYQVVAQQIPALVLQHGGIVRDAITKTIGRTFRELRPGLVEELLAHMLQTETLWQDAGVLWFGSRSDKEFGRRHVLELLSVFTSPLQIQVRFGNTDIGTVDPL